MGKFRIIVIDILSIKVRLKNDSKRIVVRINMIVNKIEKKSNTPNILGCIL